MMSEYIGATHDQKKNIFFSVASKDTDQPVHWKLKIINCMPQNNIWLTTNNLKKKKKKKNQINQIKENKMIAGKTHFDLETSIHIQKGNWQTV